jgi:hypothetical protein
MKTYKFQTVCSTGVTKTFICEAQDFAKARLKLTEFVVAN